jgi:predicted acylesterase/phospholipase RssA
MIGLALSGGSSKGALQVGMLKYMSEQKMLDQVSVACGTSTGALNACGLSMLDEDPELAVIRLEEIWRAIRSKDDIFESCWWTLRGLYRTDPLRDLLDTMVKRTESHIEAVACCVDLAQSNTPLKFFSNRELDKYDFVEAVEASCIVPFTVALKQGGLADGGIRSLVPAPFVAMKENVDQVIVMLTSPEPVDVGVAVSPPWYVPPMLYWGFRTIDIGFQEEIKKTDLIEARFYKEKVTVIAPKDPIKISYTDFTPSTLHKLIDDGYELAREALGG